MKRSYSLDLVKLLLAYVIVLFHVDKWVGPGPTVTVQVFFVISGYFLAGKYYSKSHGDPEKRFGPWQYTLEHVRGLYRDYLVAWVLFTGYALARCLAVFAADPGAGQLHSAVLTVYDQLPDLLLLQSAHSYGVSLNGPTWQLSAMIIAGYFIYGLLCHDENLARTLLFPAAILMVQCLLHTGQDLFSRVGFFFMPLLRAFSPMCVGVLTYCFARTEHWQKLKAHRPLFQGLVLAALPALVLFEDRNDLHLIWSAALVLGCMDPDSLLRRWTDRPCFRGCGRVSYVLYLNHAVFCRFYVNIFAKLLARVGIVLEDPWYTALYLAALTVFCLVLGWVTDRLPFLPGGRRDTRR